MMYCAFRGGSFVGIGESLLGECAFGIFPAKYYYTRRLKKENHSCEWNYIVSTTSDLVKSSFLVPSSISVGVRGLEQFISTLKSLEVHVWFSVYMKSNPTPNWNPFLLQSPCLMTSGTPKLSSTLAIGKR